ncbi:hypothetical protein ELG61_14530 [Rhizobium leguminosarum]|nr:hypothetical protein ELG86_15040 [Rhizobium leguminosarum]TBF99734.1 hypothetical protein ELG85_13800 [Rhizobium leguminosarum]TBG68920.1 hypothetical protein ELG74_14120 [Rhizobium leguminosarum]TBH02808.1 hypothetical protein ELG70_14800 [Rhizobium leguminosarum]TBH12252.1 hypothetical protein ELG68_14435 [Rhizobium leguminosarum]
MTRTPPRSSVMSVLCRGSAAPDADARDKPKHDGRRVGASSRRRFCDFLGGDGSMWQPATPIPTACYFMTFTFNTISLISPSPTGNLTTNLSRPM